MSDTAQLYGRRYPWRKWFALKRFTLRRFRDFSGRVDTFAQQIRNAAAPGRHNVRVSIKMAHDGNSLTVHVLGPRPRGKVGTGVGKGKPSNSHRPARMVG